MKRVLTLGLSLLMVITTLFALPFTAKAANDDGLIVFRDEFVAWGVDGLNPNDLSDVVFYAGENVKDGVYGELLSSYKGVTYDEKSNTLTLDNVKQVTNAFFVQIQSMGNLTVRLVGTSALVRLDIYDTVVTFTGSGTLNINPALSWSRWKGTDYEEIRNNEHIMDRAFCCSESTVKITGGAKLHLENGSAEEATAEFSFATSKTTKQLNEQIFTYGSSSSSPVWEAAPYVTEAYDEPVKIKNDLVLHQFPVSSLIKCTGASTVSQYWIKSAVDDYGYNDYHISPLILTDDGVWVEDVLQGFQYRDGEYYALTPDGFYDSAPTENIGFEYYSDFSGIPSSLANEGTVTACLSKKYTGNSDELYKSGNTEFALHMSGSSKDYYNANVNPSVPAEPEYNYSYSMFYIRTVGNTKYLEFCEIILDNSVDTTQARQIAKNRGYEAEVIHYDEETTYYYLLKNSPSVTFSSTAIHTHSYAAKVTKAATCGTAGVTTYTCSCGDSYTKSIPATGKHTTDKGTLTKKATYTATGVKTYKCTVCGKVLKTESIDKLPKKKNPITAKAKSVSIKFSKLKSKSQYVKAKDALTVSKAKGALKYAKDSGNKKITVDKKTGKITVKKGLKKGTYKVKIIITAAGNSTYKKGSVTVTVKIKVK